MSEIRVLEIPKWGLSMEEGTVLEWLIDVGDDFSEGQEICEIESSKIVNVLEAPFCRDFAQDHRRSRATLCRCRRP